MNNEVKLFSENCIQNSQWNEMLLKSSRSEGDAAQRKAAYEKVFSNYADFRELIKNFSGMAEIPLLSNQYFNATVASYVRSFAGYLTIERAMDQPTALLWYVDLLGVTDNRKVLPNLGKEDLEGINSRFRLSAHCQAGQATYDISTNKKLIPGSVEIGLSIAGESYIVRDDAKGHLLAPAGVLTAGSVNYSTGMISFTLGAGSSVTADDSYMVSGFEDVAGDPAFGSLTGPGNNRFKISNNNIVVTSEPDMLIAENNLMAIAAMQKAIGANPAEITGAKLTELYTKLVNGKFVAALKAMWSGNVQVIDLRKASNNWLDFNSYLEKFMAELVNVDTWLAERSVKGVKATAYVCSLNVANLFRKLKPTGNFVDNVDSTYINDLVGFYNGVPVMRHNDIEGETIDGVACDIFYAVCKTADGNLAPIMRGIFLPLTNTPVVGNYNNPSQFANGVYYQEANEPIVPELMLKVGIAQDF